MLNIKKESIVSQIDFIKKYHNIDMTNVYLVKKYAHMYSFYDLLYVLYGEEKGYIKYIENKRKEWIPVVVPDFKLIDKVRKRGAINIMKLDRIGFDTYEKRNKKKREKELIKYLQELDKERINKNAKSKTNQRRSRKAKREV